MVILTDNHIDLLGEYLKQFKNANIPGKTKVIEQAADVIERNWPENVRFNREVVQTVREHSTPNTILYSYIFLDRRPVPL